MSLFDSLGVCSVDHVLLFVHRYFETCHFLTADFSPAERAERDERFASCEGPEERSETCFKWSSQCHTQLTLTSLACKLGG